MNKQEIEDMLKTVSDSDLVPIESVIGITIADKYKELRSVPIDLLNSLIDKEREHRDLPKILWDDPIKKQAIFEADLLEILCKGK